ncbi:MAG: hypothetical protein WBH20_14730 [Oceanisphaera sp.]|uniref:hypothetical protein n=1 Tax=Oceanisphaera sp. TaxID=1929979 RepID=UPI003C759FB6
MTQIITQRQALITQLQRIPGADVKSGFLAQFLHIARHLELSPLITLQPATDTAQRTNETQVAAGRTYQLMIAVNAGEAQDDDMNRALHHVRSVLYYGNRLKQLGKNTFELGTTEFFLPEGYDCIYASQTPIVLNYTDQLTHLE